MKAAVITSFDQAPRYTDFAEPVPERPEELLVEVLAAGLHHLTRGRASAAHYTSSGGLPLVPGVDGVGREALIALPLLRQFGCCSIQYGLAPLRI